MEMQKSAELYKLNILVVVAVGVLVWWCMPVIALHYCSRKSMALEGAVVIRSLN